MTEHMTKPKRTPRDKHPQPQPGAPRPRRYTFTDWACL